MLELSMFSSLSLGVIHNVSEKSQESLHLNEYFIFTCLFCVCVLFLMGFEVEG